MKKPLSIGLLFCSIMLFGACSQPDSTPENTRTGNEEADNGGADAGLSVDEKRALVRDYLNENINEISPIEPVLGGTFYVTSIVWKQDGSALVNYEDGHIAVSALLKYDLTNNGEVDINSFEVQRDQ